jgi:hypothetical protein
MSILTPASGHCAHFPYLSFFGDFFSPHQFAFSRPLFRIAIVWTVLFDFIFNYLINDGVFVWESWRKEEYKFVLYINFWLKLWVSNIAFCWWMNFLFDWFKNQANLGFWSPLCLPTKQIPTNLLMLITTDLSSTTPSQPTAPSASYLFNIIWKREMLHILSTILLRQVTIDVKHTRPKFNSHFHCHVRECTIRNTCSISHWILLFTWSIRSVQTQEYMWIPPFFKKKKKLKENTLSWKIFLEVLTKLVQGTVDWKLGPITFPVR